MQVIERMIPSENHRAFGDVGIPARDDIVLADYVSVDAEVMVHAWQGRHWTTRDVFLHRESIFALSAIGYRAYVAAFLVEGLTYDVKYGPDIRGFSFRVCVGRSASSGRSARASSCRWLDPVQRAAIVSVLRHFVYGFRDNEALEVLREWGA